MLRAIWNSVSAMNAQQDKLNIISNNIANVNTVGYKSENANFQDLVYETLKRNGYPVNPNSDTALESGTGTKITENIRNTQEGNITETGQKTDLAIDGEGFFRVTLPNGEVAYERAGNFNFDRNGTLVDSNGNKVNIEINDEGGEVKPTADNFTVDRYGNIYVKSGDDTISYGKISVYNVIGDDSMISIGNNLYYPKNGAQIYENNDASIYQGMLEESNVDLSKEMTDMILSQRAFELNSKALTTSDDMWELINNMRR
ncbi:flagellar basal body rod protein FlgG [Clostridium sp. cel8]|jgi:flagellar basal-body rod protein FlgG|uniref:flagellar hook-basal body complex protein n=1 Tax=unclassified Clostridium TaxID=2614128 RepID=UPI0015F60001|nr:flagellar hook-basal body complex protein [Clostridium sp. cel8]MBA5850669.1 flagellar basal body rod protein FlgG [Clostridium sp. cel8]